MSESEKQSEAKQPVTRSQVGGVGVSESDGMDPASRALAEALRLSFVVLKLVMVCILAVFIWSGFYTVEENEVGIKLRFGKVQGSGLSRIKSPGLHWKWPNPIDEVIKVPASKQVRSTRIDSFWYYEPTARKNSGYSFTSVPMRFVQDGYALTASGGSVQVSTEPGALPTASRFERVRAPGADYNIAHTRWQLRYYISDPIRFVEYLWDGTEGTLADRDGWYAVEALLRYVVSDSIILASAHRDIDEIIWKSPENYIREIRLLTEKRLEELEVGVSITDLDLIDKTPPLQVKHDFVQANNANIQAQKLVNQARAAQNEIVNQAKADAMVIKARATSYSKSVEQAAKAEAAYLETVLSKIEAAAAEKTDGSTTSAAYQQAYHELLSVTVDQLYQEMLREIIDKADEVFVMPSGKGEPTEVRMHLSRDASLRPRTAEEEIKRK
jgi:modulator of FtsH protease HflK